MSNHKFKAWDEGNKKWMFPMGVSPLFLLSCDYCMDFSFRESDLVWVQWTGKNDKDDDPIYQGHIVIDDTTHKIFEVKWVDGGFNIINDRFFRIIGNIFENKELLGEKNE